MLDGLGWVPGRQAWSRDEHPGEIGNQTASSSGGQVGLAQLDYARKLFAVTHYWLDRVNPLSIGSFGQSARFGQSKVNQNLFRNAHRADAASSHRYQLLCSFKIAIRRTWNINTNQRGARTHIDHWGYDKACPLQQQGMAALALPGQAQSSWR